MSSLLCWRSVSGARHAPPPGRPRVSRVAGWGGGGAVSRPDSPLSRRFPRRASHQDEGRARSEVLQSGGQDGQHHHLRVGRDRRPHPAGGHHPPDQRVRMGPGVPPGQPFVTGVRGCERARMAQLAPVLWPGQRPEITSQIKNLRLHSRTCSPWAHALVGG